MSSVVSERGQITIDKSVRRALQVEPGMVAVQVVVGDHLEIYFVPAKHNRSAFGMLKLPSGTEIPSWDEVEKRAARSIADEAR